MFAAVLSPRSFCRLFLVPSGLAVAGLIFTVLWGAAPAAAAPPTPLRLQAAQGLTATEPPQAAAVIRVDGRDGRRHWRQGRDHRRDGYRGRKGHRHYGHRDYRQRHWNKHRWGKHPGHGRGFKQGHLRPHQRGRHAGRACHPVRGLGHHHGRRALFGAVMCYDRHGEGYILRGSRHLLRYLFR